MGILEKNQSDYFPCSSLGFSLRNLSTAFPKEKLFTSGIKKRPTPHPVKDCTYIIILYTYR
jgi:hypothetical protein